MRHGGGSWLFATATALMLMASACSGPDRADDPAIGVPPTSTNTTTATSPPTDAARDPFLDNGRACRHIVNDEGDRSMLCADDLGFPAIRGAAFGDEGTVVAIVDADVEVRAQLLDSGLSDPLPIIDVDGVGIVVADDVQSLVATTTAGSTHRAPVLDGLLGDDSIEVAAGDAEFGGASATWSLRFTRSEEVCLVIDQEVVETLVMCTGEGADPNVVAGTAPLKSPDLRWCDRPVVEVIFGVGFIDPGSTVELRLDDHEASTATVELPNGRRAGYGITAEQIGDHARADVWLTLDGRPLRTPIGLSEPPPDVATYPDACPTAATTEGSGDTPTVTYPAT